MTRIRSVVANFVRHFRQQATAIAGVTDPLFRQLLAAAALDPLARAAYGKPKRHRDNLQRLVEELTTWNARDRVSLIQLRLRLSEQKRARFRLYREATRRWKLLPPAHCYPGAELSPTFDEMLPFAASMEVGVLQDCRYSALFCAHRNTLVHEFRPPGYGHDWSESKTRAFYGPSAFSERELIFPPGFFRYILDEAINGVEQHLLIQHIDPYARFEFGST